MTQTIGPWRLTRAAKAGSSRRSRKQLSSSASVEPAPSCGSAARRRWSILVVESVGISLPRGVWPLAVYLLSAEGPGFDPPHSCAGRGGPRVLPLRQGGLVGALLRRQGKGT